MLSLKKSEQPLSNSLHALPYKCVNALLPACWADDRRCFDSELIIIHLNKTLLIGSSPRLIPRHFDFVSNRVSVNAVGARVGNDRPIQFSRLDIRCFRTRWGL